MKNVWILFLLVGLLVGCTAPIKQVEDTTVGTPVASGPVMRSFSASTVSSGDTIIVTLTKNLNADQTTLLTEDYFPAGWSVVDAGTGTVAGNAIRWAELTGAKSGAYTYSVKATSDSGTWSGQYSVNGATPVDIGGSKTLT